MIELAADQRPSWFSFITRKRWRDQDYRRGFAGTEYRRDKNRSNAAERADFTIARRSGNDRRETMQNQGLRIAGGYPQPANASENGNALDHKFCKQIISWSSKPSLLPAVSMPQCQGLLSSTQSKFIDVMTGRVSSGKER